MPPLARLFLGLLLVFFWLRFELSLRRRRGVAPSRFRDLRCYLDRRTSPRPEWIPFLFVFSSLLCFSFWEYLLFHMFGRGEDQLTWIVAVLLWGGALYRRKKRVDQGALRLEFVDFLLLGIVWALLFKSTLALLFLVWLRLRARFLFVSKL